MLTPPAGEAGLTFDSRVDIFDPRVDYWTQLSPERAMARPRLRPGSPPTAERLLQAAEAEFGRVGLARARLEDIARAAGIGRPALLYHFPTKEALYGAVVERAFARLTAALLPVLALPGGFDLRMEALVQAFTRFLEREPAFAPLLIREVMDGEGPGRELILAGVVPILRQVERALRAWSTGTGTLPPAFPIRQALLTIAAAALLRASAGPLREPLWGRGDALPELARRLVSAPPSQEVSP